MTEELLMPDLKEMGLPFLVGNSAVEIERYIEGVGTSIDSVFMVGEALNELSQNERELSNIDYSFLREPFERAYGKRSGREIKTFQDLRKNLEEVSDKYRSFSRLPYEEKEKLKTFSLVLYRQMLYYGRMGWIDIF